MKLEDLKTFIQVIIDDPGCEDCADPEFSGECRYYKKDKDGKGYHCEEPEPIDRIMKLIKQYIKERNKGYRITAVKREGDPQWLKLDRI